MDQYVKVSIDSRRDTIFNSFNVNDKFKKKIDDLFKKIEELGKTCKDSADFEAKFAASPLNQEYMDLFTELATAGTVKPLDDKAKKEQDQSMAEAVAEGVMSTAADNVKRAVLPTRASIHQKAYDEARKIPGVGEALHVKQYADLFGGFRRAKKAKEEQEQLKKELEDDKKD